MGVAQCAVVIPAGVTSLEPTQTNFLQALNIGSKITKGMIEIIAEVRLFEEGDKVDGSQAALLQKMDIQPFAYGLVCIKVFDDGSLFDPEVLGITEEQVISIFKTGVKNIAAVCIECEMPTMAPCPTPSSSPTPTSWLSLARRTTASSRPRPCVLPLASKSWLHDPVHLCRSHRGARHISELKL